MRQKLIPEHIDPYRYADQGLGLDGEVKISDMERLSALVLPTDPKVAFTLDFGIDEQKIVNIKGKVNTVLTLQCQRCLGPLEYEILSDFALGVVKNFDEANELPDHYEPVLVNEENQLALRDLIEDELLLNLPIIPKHEEKDCQVKLPLTDKDWAAQEKENPFQVLESLKKK